MSTADIVLYSNKQRKRRILWKCALGNTIQDVLNSRIGWAQTSTDDWQFYWVSREWMNSTFDRYKFKEGQVVCHFRNDYELCRKDSLIKNHKKYRKSCDSTTNLDYLPASYVLPSEYHLFVEEFRKYPPDTIWIMKPVAGAQGKGIFLFKKLKDITEWKKFRPLNVWVHREGFARFSHSRYSIESFEDAFVHLTNVAIAKSAADYDPERGLKWSLDKLKRYIHATYGIEAVDKLLEKIAGIIIYSLKSVQSLIIQVNASPSLTPSSQEDFEMKFRVLSHLLDVIDVEKVRIGNETNVAGFDLLIKNNESVYRPESTTNASINPECFVPKLNIRLGNYVAPMQMP